MDSYTRSLWWMFGSSAGARSRIRIVQTLRKMPMNALQLSQELGLDYGTVRHHLKVLESNRLIEGGGQSYGRVYAIAQSLEDHWKVMEEILARYNDR